MQRYALIIWATIRNRGDAYNHFDNPLIAKVLHVSTVGAGFIPALPTADKIQSKYLAAARVVINPTPTECCNYFEYPVCPNIINHSAEIYLQYSNTVHFGF